MGKENAINSWTQTVSPLQGRAFLKLKCKEAANEVRYLASTRGVIYVTVSLQHSQFRRKENDRFNESGVEAVGKGWHCHLPDATPAWMDCHLQLRMSRIALPLGKHSGPDSPCLFLPLPPSSSLPTKLEAPGTPDSHLGPGSHTQLCSLFSHLSSVSNYNAHKHGTDGKEQAGLGV